MQTEDAVSSDIVTRVTLGASQGQRERKTLSLLAFIALTRITPAFTPSMRAEDAVSSDGIVL